MKKAELLHTTILILAILTGYTAMQSVVYFLSYIAYATDSTASTGLLLYRLFPALLFAAACVLLIRNGRKYTAALLKKADPEEMEQEDDETDAAPETDSAPGTEAAPLIEASEDKAIIWQLDRRNIVFVLFIGMGLYSIIQSSPYVIVDLFELFRNKVSSDMFRQGSPGIANLIIQLLQFTIGAFLIYAAPTLTNFIEKTIAVRLDSTSQTR